MTQPIKLKVSITFDLEVHPDWYKGVRRGDPTLEEICDQERDYLADDPQYLTDHLVSNHYNVTVIPEGLVSHGGEGETQQEMGMEGSVPDSRADQALQEGQPDGGTPESDPEE